MALQADGEDIVDAHQVDALFTQHFKQPLGALFKVVRHRLALPEATEASITEAVSARNRLTQ